MMSTHMGGGIGTILLFGWPISDWAVLMLLFVVSVLTIALVGSIIGVVTSWFARPAPWQAGTRARLDPEEPTK